METVEGYINDICLTGFEEKMKLCKVISMVAGSLKVPPKYKLL